MPSSTSRSCLEEESVPNVIQQVMSACMSHLRFASVIFRRRLRPLADRAAHDPREACPLQGKMVSLQSSILRSSGPGLLLCQRIKGRGYQRGPCLCFTQGNLLCLHGIQ